MDPASSPPRPPGRHRRPAPARQLAIARITALARAAATVVAAATLVALPLAVMIAAAPHAASAEGEATLKEVIINLRNVIISLLVALATLFLTVGGLRYILAGGDPGEVEAGKKTLKYAAVGYGIAALAPVLVEILTSVVKAD